MKIDVYALRAMTDDAIRTAEADRKARLIAEERARCGYIGKDTLWDYDDSSAVSGAHTLNPGMLVGPGKLVYDSLVTSGLRVSIDYWHDGIGVGGGYNIVVHW